MATEPGDGETEEGEGGAGPAFSVGSLLAADASGSPRP